MKIILVLLMLCSQLHSDEREAVFADLPKQGQCLQLIMLNHTLPRAGKVKYKEEVGPSLVILKKMGYSQDSVITLNRVIGLRCGYSRFQLKNKSELFILWGWSRGSVGETDRYYAVNIPRYDPHASTISEKEFENAVVKNGGSLWIEYRDGGYHRIPKSETLREDQLVEIEANILYEKGKFKVEMIKGMRRWFQLNIVKEDVLYFKLSILNRSRDTRLKAEREMFRLSYKKVGGKYKIRLYRK